MEAEFNIMTPKAVNYAWVNESHDWRPAPGSPSHLYRYICHSFPSLFLCHLHSGPLNVTPFAPSFTNICAFYLMKCSLLNSPYVRQKMRPFMPPAQCIMGGLTQDCQLSFFQLFNIACLFIPVFLFTLSPILPSSRYISVFLSAIYLFVNGQVKWGSVSSVGSVRRVQRRWQVMCSRGPTGELRCLGQSNGVFMYPGRGEAPGWGTWEKERGFFFGRR